MKFVQNSTLEILEKAVMTHPSSQLVALKGFSEIRSKDRKTVNIFLVVFAIISLLLVSCPKQPQPSLNQVQELKYETKLKPEINTRTPEVDAEGYLK